MLSVSRRDLLVGAALIAAAPQLAFAQTADPAREPVQSLCDGLLAIMKGAKQLGFRGRMDRIGPVVDRSFDLGLMIRLAVGPAWTGMTSGDQALLTAAFRRMTVAQYASNFNSFSGERFVVDPKVEARGGDRLVRTTLGQPGEKPVSLAYRVRQSGGQWKIVDVFYQNAISQLATRRSDFAAVLASGGAKALVRHLDQLADKAAS